MGVTQSRPMARGKLVDLVLIVGAAALVLVTAGITVLGQLVHTAGGGSPSATDIGAGTLSDGLVRAGRVRALDPGRAAALPVRARRAACGSATASRARS